MSLNTANTPDGKGVLIYNGEAILLYTKHVTMSFNHTNLAALKGKKNGSLYLTSHRIIFVCQCNDGMRSFSMPFFALRDVKLEQPILSPNYLKGTIQAQPGGNFEGEVTWKLSFSKGGCVDFGQALLQAADMAQRYRPYDAPPSYAPAPGNFYAAPPGYYITQQNYHGFTAPTHAFPEQPPAGEVYMYESPPPYPGIAGPTQQVAGPPAPYPAGQIGGNVYQPYGHPPMPTQPYPNQPQASQPPPYSAYAQQSNQPYPEAGPLPSKPPIN